MAAKKAKLQEQFSEDVAKEGSSQSNASSNIFHGVAIFVNGYTVPSADSLKRMMMMHGGMYHHYQSDKTTHIIASNLPNCKLKQLRTMKVVKPNWIVDSVQEHRLLDYRQYLLYTSRAQARLNFGQSEVESVTVVQGTKTVSENNKSASIIQTDMSTSDVAEEKQLSHATARNATEPNFLSEFYSHSRLHHISTMGALFKQYVTQLREESDGRFPGQKRLREFGTMNNNSQNLSSDRTIMHIDMDCFFVSVGLRDRPHLKGLPVAVTHAKGNIAPSHQRKGVDLAFEMNYYKQKSEIETVSNVDEIDSLSEIASCSYEARKCGLKNGMFLGTALKLCPNLKTIPYDFEGYKEVSYCLYNTVAAFTLDIEAVSCDEMFVDCKDVLRNTCTSPVQFASFLRQEIKDKTGCSASAGFGSNRLQARLATKKAKPDGQFYLEPSMVTNFMLDIVVEDLPGVGRNLTSLLHVMGARTCSDLQRFSQAHLQQEFGVKTGNALYMHCRGKDDRVLSFSHQRKSVSAEVNYGIRFTSQEEATAFLKQLAGEVSSRLKKIKLKGRCITLKLMVRAKEAPIETAKFLGHGVCDHVTRSSTLTTAVADQDTIAREVLSIAKQLSVKPSDMRGVGIQVTRLESDSMSSKFLDRFLLRATRGTQQANSSRAPKEERNTQQTVRASNVGSPVVQNRVSPQQASSNIAPQQEVCTSKGELTSRLQFEISPYEVCDLDEEVLAALPEDIRQEILQTCQSSSNLQVQKDEVVTNMKSPVIEQVDMSLYNSMTVNQVRSLMKEWVSCEDTPQPCDVSMLADYLERQVASRNIDDIILVVRCLYRCVYKKKSGVWQEAYHNIMKKVQDMMLVVYGAKLKLQDTFT
ncbi:DNA repair protein REV1 isoform X2 [Zootermopsis nevadensis]|nr:DNA repair protein REV1 isoform X2 [Zootermopsis nevadensis]XP_021918565.1 DNA repair protein REV1 isoform X2 [Zootermopsis nevadensis]XP_021918566.1 DNA repair protein REV1 isoform X2 [Zootermopsis nevadensis]XP_021918567.1 DNA repair protein REV1 isoform X2 [Zootermopsis nevadensis]